MPSPRALCAPYACSSLYWPAAPQPVRCRAEGLVADAADQGNTVAGVVAVAGGVHLQIHPGAGGLFFLGPSTPRRAWLLARRACLAVRHAACNSWRATSFMFNAFSSCAVRVLYSPALSQSTALHTADYSFALSALRPYTTHALPGGKRRVVRGGPHRAY